MDLKQRGPDTVHQIQMAHSRIHRLDVVNKASNLQVSKLCFRTRKFIVLNGLFLHGESAEQKSAY
jgi:hypothetical protein